MNTLRFVLANLTKWAQNNEVYPCSELTAPPPGSLNHHVTVVPHHLALDSSNALPLVKQYGVILDCTDNVATRYLLNDACVLGGRPLVSGSALRFEGQLTTYK